MERNFDPARDVTQRVTRGIGLCLAIAGLLLCAGSGLAQPRRPAWTDPLDEQGADGLDLTSPPQVLVPAPSAPARPPRAVGEVLNAVSGVREREHAVAVRLEQGLAFVTVTARFTNRMPGAEDVIYRLAIPNGATLARVGACVDAACRDIDSADGLGAGTGVPGPVMSAPAVTASRVSSERGDALELHASPVTRYAELLVRVTYVAPAPLVGGVARIDLPARGTDPRVAPSLVTVQSPGLLAPTVDGTAADVRPVAIDAWFPMPVAATSPTHAPASVTATRAACGAGTCVRVHAVAGPARGMPVDLVLLVDASPSTQGPERGRIAAAITAIVASLPAGSRVRAAAFGGRARALIEASASSTEVELGTLVNVTAGELGSATRFEAAWALVRPWVTGARRAGEPRPTIVIVGDGGLTDGADAAAAFAQARRAGVQVSTVSVGDRVTSETLVRGVASTGGMVVRAASEADAATRGREGGRLEERLAALFAPTVAPQVMLVSGRTRERLGELRAGEEVSWEGPMRAGTVVEVAGRRVVPRAASAETATALGKRLERIARSSRVDEGTPRAAPTASRTSLPAEPLLTVLRQRVIPVARGCFRLDRAGRANYRARAEFEFRLADREVVEANVHGRIDPALRQCLLAAVDALEVPRFEGSVVVHYPLVTQPELPPPVLDLAPALSDRIDSL